MGVQRETVSPGPTRYNLSTASQGRRGPTVRFGTEEQRPRPRTGALSVHSGAYLSPGPAKFAAFMEAFPYEKYGGPAYVPAYPPQMK